MKARVPCGIAAIALLAAAHVSADPIGTAATGAPGSAPDSIRPSPSAGSSEEDPLRNPSLVADAPSPRDSATSRQGADSPSPGTAVIARPRPVRGRLPASAATLGGVHDLRFRNGEFGGPAVRSFDLAGSREEWIPWVGLPLVANPEQPEGPLPENGAGAARLGPQMAGALDQSLALSSGDGLAWRARPSSDFPDTARTGLSFFRGALGSYRFGLDLERAVVPGWGLRLSMQTRSAQGRQWEYRDQINSIYTGAGRTKDDIPATGRSLGQDDSRWEIAAIRQDAFGHAELGWAASWNWPGLPDPRRAEAGDSRIDRQARFLSRAGFLRYESDHPDWIVDFGAIAGSFRGRHRTWGDSTGLGRLAWGLPGGWNETRAQGNGRFGRRLGRMALGLSAGASYRTFSSILGGPSEGPLDEDVERAGLWAQGDTSGSARWGAEARLDRLSSVGGQVDYDWDGRTTAGWVDRTWSVSLGLSRILRQPLAELVALPDPLSRHLPDPGLATETSWLGEGRVAVRPWQFLLLEAGGALLAVDDRIAREFVAANPAPDLLLDEDAAVALSNLRGTSWGYSALAGASIGAAGFFLRGEARLGEFFLPGAGFSGARDLSIPAGFYRGVTGYEGRLLSGRFAYGSNFDWSYWTSHREWVPDWDGAARAVGFGGVSRLDWENWFEISTFRLFWRVENLLDVQEHPAPGWYPVGIRSGYGVTWSFRG